MLRSGSRILLAGVMLALSLATGGVLLAQIEGSDRGVAPLDSSGTFEVSGVNVDVSAKSADAARYGGWRLAQRRAWATLAQRLGSGAGALPDGALDGLVSGIVVENEQIGPTRYVARLGVLFDRARAAPILGVSSGGAHSPPMLVVPVIWSGGAGGVFERRTEWQQAWARFRTGSSSIDYVRVTGTGPDSLLINAGLTGRPGRGWWRTVLGQYGALNVLIPVVHLYRQWPDGPVIGVFQARHGPDNRLIATFTLQVKNGDALPALLDAGVKRIDGAYQQALASGVLRTDPGLTYRSDSDATNDATDDTAATEGDETVTSAGATTQIVQFDSPSAAAVTTTEAAIRSVPGVRSAVTSSLALGGISVMRVVYEGDLGALNAALQARGWQVVTGSGAIRIRRASPSLPPPDVPPDNAVAG